jgi:hypothetical protein
MAEVCVRPRSAEFAAIDRPLTAAEMAQLRKVSTRGQVSASSFVNHYEWGGLKADPADWMRRYFDESQLLIRRSSV